MRGSRCSLAFLSLLCGPGWLTRPRVTHICVTHTSARGSLTLSPNAAPLAWDASRWFPHWGLKRSSEILVPPHLCVSVQRSPPQRPWPLWKVKGQPSLLLLLPGGLGPWEETSPGWWAPRLTSWGAQGTGLQNSGPSVCCRLPAEPRNKTICCSLMPLKEQYHKPDVTGHWTQGGLRPVRGHPRRGRGRLLLYPCHSVQFSRSVVSDSLRPHESQHARPPCPSPTPGVHSDSRPSSQ